MTEVLRVYAIVRRTTSSAEGAHGADLRLIRWREVAAVAEVTTNDPPSPTAEAILRHEAIVEAVRRRGAALPVRFATTFHDEKSLIAALADRYDVIAADLDRLGDKAELGLTALWASSPIADERASMASGVSSPGAAYLRARAAELEFEETLRARARAAAFELDTIIGIHSIDRRASFLPTTGVAFRSAYLLDASGERGFRRAFDAARHGRSDLRLVLTGPWPPYSFVRSNSTYQKRSLE